MKRINEGFLSQIENDVLYKLLKIIPKWITPDILTFIALFSALLSGAGYIFINKYPALLLLINFLIFLHWFADGLDGKLAKERKIGRPNYGFYVDHICDCLSIIFITIGILFSSTANPFLTTLVIMVILLSLIHSYLKTVATGTFDLSVGVVGGTEMRVGIIIINTIIFFSGNPSFYILKYYLSIVDIITIFVILTFGPTLLIKIILTSEKLNKQDTKNLNIKHEKT